MANKIIDRLVADSTTRYAKRFGGQSPTLAKLFGGARQTMNNDQ
jgi:hypothetical protein